MMLETICGYCRNWFTNPNDIVINNYSIVDGAVSGIDAIIADGQYFRITGSVFNDGVHRKTDILTDEIFFGAIWPMKVPREVVELSEHMQEWQDKNEAVLESPYAMESFGGYTYTKASSATGADNSVTGVFSRQLSRWRKI